MRSGRLDRIIDIQTFTVTQDSYGAEVPTPSRFAQVHASIQPLRAQERFLSAGVHAEREAKFTIRYLPGLKETMQILYDSLIWKITGIAEIGRREGLEVTAAVIK